MIGRILLLTALAALAACNEQAPTAEPLAPATPVKDTTVVGFAYTENDPITGEEDSTRTYFLAYGGDTSDFHCLVYKSAGSGKYQLNLRFDKGTKTYEQRMTELAWILPAIATDYPADSLRGINLGRLIYSGDLAIDITKEYRRQFPHVTGINYSRVSAFLKESKLGTDFNALLKPYRLEIDRISCEKIFFASLKEVQSVSKLATDTTQAPAKVLDCMTWLRLKKI